MDLKLSVSFVLKLFWDHFLDIMGLGFIVIVGYGFFFNPFTTPSVGGEDLRPMISYMLMLYAGIASIETAIDVYIIKKYHIID